MHEVFQAKWPDGQITRMSVHCEIDPITEMVVLDLGRAVRLSWAAYESRPNPTCTTIAEGRFERNGIVLEEHHNIDICEHGVDPF